MADVAYHWPTPKELARVDKSINNLLYVLCKLRLISIDTRVYGQTCSTSLLYSNYSY